MNFISFLKSLRPYLWRIVFTVAGFVSAISIMTVGFWETFLVLFCCGIGYVIGLLHDKDMEIIKRLKILWSKRV